MVESEMRESEGKCCATCANVDCPFKYRGILDRCCDIWEPNDILSAHIPTSVWSTTWSATHKENSDG